MKKRDRGLLGEIERGALDERTSLTSLLRKCIVLGGQAGSEKLRDWARKELQGYEGDAEAVPQYRRVPAMIAVDGRSFNALIQNEQISRYDLPDFAQKHIGEEVRFRDGIAHLEELARSSEETMKLTLPASADIMSFMNAEIAKEDPYRMVTRLYWVVGRSSIKAVVEQVRTSLVELVAEMVAAMPDDQAEPNKEAADQAVNVVFNGGKRNNITFVNSQASTGGTSTVEGPKDAAKPESWWQRWRKRGVIIGVATVVAAAAAVLELTGWAPWK